MKMPGRAIINPMGVNIRGLITLTSAFREKKARRKPRTITITPNSLTVRLAEVNLALDMGFP
jgi:hypothetical protein